MNLSAPVHSKTYAWFDNKNNGVVGFLGSANYSLNAFSNRQNEAMNENSPNEIYDYYHMLLDSSVNCMDTNISEIFTLNDERLNRRFDVPQSHFDRESRIIDTDEMECIRLNLTTERAGPLRVPERSGLNWGQRPEESREPNQAYIAIPADIQRSGFFPDRGIPFVIYTDDNKYLDCVRAQDNGKGLHTYRDNSTIGVYFRERIGVRLGNKVGIDDLRRYGRTDVLICKIDNENYYMDFSV